MAHELERHGHVTIFLTVVCMKKIVIGVGLLLGLYLVVRAVAEPFVIDMTDPATYRSDWGGPSLAGVLLVHCGPGGFPPS